MKRFFSAALVIMMCLGFGLFVGNTVEATDNKDCIDGSYLTDDDTSEVTVNAMTRGVYLGSGSSTMSKVGTGKIAAGGTTIGQQVVSNISISVRVERLVNGTWEIYTSWSAERYNAASVSSSKALSVPTGYYYRTHCYHWANSDSSSSVSGGVWI